MNKIIIISGSSGAGKDSVLQGLLTREKKLREVSTYTTRAKRSTEKECQGHYFINEKRFNKLFKTGEILEKNLYNDAWYGVSKSAIEKILKDGQTPILEIDSNGYKNLKEIYPDAVGIYIDCTAQEAQMRLENRGDVSQKQIKERLAIKKIEDRQKMIFDLVVENQPGKLSQTIDTILNFIKKQI